MGLDRVLKNLSTGDKKGDIVPSDKFKNRDILVAKGALAPVSTPPLSELPGWSKRIEKLEHIGIVTVQDLLDGDSKVIAKAFRYKTIAPIEKWKKEATDWLKPPKVESG